jgi:predicted DCC family thiol-disulfide oxidoreductase YuxK
MNDAPTTIRGQGIILFDGVCNLCNGAVTFIIDRDRDAYFTFAPLQSDTARELLGEEAERLESIVLVEDGKHYTESTAALRIARRLRGPWPLLYGFIIVPRGLRDRVYRFIAANRYRWFGKTDSCRLPTPELRKRFL